MRGAVLDLDGVLTDTAAQHERAWAAVFPGLTHLEYLQHLDGLPRLDGVRTLLAARGRPIDEGEVERLGQAKNTRFREILARDGVDVLAENVAAVRAWRRRGVAVALVSSSRNTARVLAAAGLEDLVDVRVDGEVAAALGLAGKPAPDLFAHAVRELGLPPRDCVAVEDAEAAVEAAAAAGIGRVVGLRRSGPLRPLWERGADAVLRSLVDVRSEVARDLPDARSATDGLLARLAGRRPALLLDYDGTLSPIVDDPGAAVLADGMRDALLAARAVAEVAVVSGRGLDDVRARTDLPGLWYAGSHGFEILDPDGRLEVHGEGRGAVPDLGAAADALEADLGDLPGVLVERKPFAIAVHFRRAPSLEERVVARVFQEADARGSLRASPGKAIVELRPDVRWDKGRAVDRLVGSMAADALPVYVGDDRTDEDAFWALLGRGLGVLVGDHGGETAAHLHLADPDGVRELLRQLS